MTAKIIDMEAHRFDIAAKRFDLEARRLGFRDFAHLEDVTQAEWEADVEAAMRAVGLDPDKPEDWADPRLHDAMKGVSR